MTGKSNNLSGYFLIQFNTEYNYKGIDTKHFEPDFTDIKLENNNSNEKQYIWQFHPNGWRKDAIKLFEENCITEISDDIYLIKNIEIALKIKQIIESRWK